MKKEKIYYGVVGEIGLVHSEDGRPWVSKDFVVATNWSNEYKGNSEVKNVKITFENL